MASELKEVRYEAVASDPTAVWQIATVANHKADMVQQQRGDFQKVMTGLQESMNRVEILLQRLANPQARVVEPRNMQDWAQSGKLEMKVTRRIEDLGQVNLNNTQGVHLLGAPEGNFNFPSTGFSVVATGWEQDQWPNDSLRRVEWENPKVPATLDGYRKLVVPVIEEYFSTGDVELAAFELRSLGSDQFHHYFVKKLISMAMDRHDKEREMASVLLSALYADLLSSSKMIEGFMMLLESTEDLAVDIPDAIDVLAVFVVRAVVDEILPPVCLTRARALLPESFKGVEVLRVAEKSYLSAPHHVELVERKWGGSTYFTVEEAKKRIQNILREYIESADDLSLDTPSAVTLFDKLVSIAISEEWRDASLSKSAIPGGTIVGREDKKRSQVVRIWDPGTGSKNMKWRRHVLTKDTVGSVKLWEITRGAVIDDFGKVPSEDKKKELFEMVSIPAWFTMHLSCLLTSSSDDETRALNALLDAFGCAFPLEDIATAYCITKGDVNRAGDFLTDPQLSMPQGNEVDPSVETNLSQIVKADEESYMENSSQTKMREKLPKSRASFGTISSMLVKGSARATALVNRAPEKEKPLKVELSEYMRDDFNVEMDESNSAPKKEKEIVLNKILQLERQLDVKQKLEQEDFMGGAEIIASPPVVSFSETVLEKSSSTVMSKSPNKHSCLYMEVLNQKRGHVFDEMLRSGTSLYNKTLHDIFSAFGTILSCKVATNEMGQSKGFGFVQYEKEEAAQSTMKSLNGILINDKPVYVGPFLCKQERDNSVDKAKFNHIIVKNLSESTTQEDLVKNFGEYGNITSAVDELNGKKINDKEWYVGRAQKKSERERGLKRRFEQSMKDAADKYPGLNLYLKKLDDSIGDDHLRELLSNFGKITSCMVKHDQNGVSKESGFVAFSTREEASHALTEMNGKMMLKKKQISSKEYFQISTPRSSSHCFQISILEDKYVFEGEVMSELVIVED